MKNKCEHKVYKDEPPRCLECVSFLCGICLSNMSNDTGICEDCIRGFDQLYLDELETTEEHNV